MFNKLNKLSVDAYMAVTGFFKGLKNDERLGRAAENYVCRGRIYSRHIPNGYLRLLANTARSASFALANTAVTRFHLNSAKLGNLLKEPIKRFKHVFVKHRVAGTALRLKAVAVLPFIFNDERLASGVYADCFGMLLKKSVERILMLTLIIYTAVSVKPRYDIYFYTTAVSIVAKPASLGHSAVLITKETDDADSADIMLGGEINDPLIIIIEGFGRLCVGVIYSAILCSEGM